MIPTNLDLGKLLKETNSTLKIGYLTYIAGLLNSIPSRTKDLYDDGNEYIPINAQELRKKVNNYKPYIQFLFDNDVIKSNHQYIVGERATGYQFTDKYLFADQDWKEINGFTLLKSLNKVDPFQVRMAKKYRYLKSCMDDNLKIDASAALDYNNQLYRFNSSVTDEQYVYNKSGKLEGKKTINAHLKFRCNEIAINEIIDQKWRFHIDKNVGRCHTNLTNLKSDFRQFITYNGQPLVSVDLKNSQPLLSGLLFNPKFYSTETEKTEILTFGKVMKERRSISNKNYKKIREISLYIMMLNNEFSIGGKGFQEYFDFVQSGTLYKEYRKAVFEATGEEIEKKQIKKEFLRTAYSKNGFISQPSAVYKRIFKDMAPEVFEVFRLFKVGDHTLLPRLLQCIESIIFLDYIAKRIRSEYKSMKIFTIHDSIVCPLGEEDKVKAIMTEEIIKATEMLPVFEVEPWIPGIKESPFYPNLKIAI